MDENKFFRFVWRFNAIVVMVAGLSVLAAFALWIIVTGLELTDSQTDSNVVSITENNEVTEELQLGDLREIDGTPYIMVPLYSEQLYTSFSSGRTTHSTRNYLFLDSRTGERKWLFPSNEYLIANDNLLSETDFESKDRTIRAIFYSIIKKDTNGDKRLAYDDLKTIAFTKPSGYDYREVISGVERLLGYKVINTESMLILYQKNGVVYSANISLEDLVLSNERELPKVEDRP